MKNKQNPSVFTLIFLLTITGSLSLFTPVQAETWTDITLPYTITQSGNYRITEGCSSSGLLLSINASNVIVDGQDKLIQSTQSEDDYAISIASGCTNILLKEFNVTGSDYGLYAIEIGNFTVQDSTFVNNTAAAIFAYNVTDFVFLHSRLSNNSNGLVVIDSSNLTIADSHFKNNTYGMQFVQCRDIVFQSNYVNNNTYGLASVGSNNTTVCDSAFTENYDGIEAVDTDLTIDNTDVSDNFEIGISFVEGNLAAHNFAVNNNTVGLYVGLCNVTVTYGSIANNLIGIYTILSNTTAVDCAINNNTNFGVAALASYSTVIDDCGVSNNSFGILSYGAQNMVLKNSVIANNSLGMNDYLGNNTLITGNIFDKNGLNEDPAFGGAVMFEETNCTATNNAFTNNNDALMIGIFSDELNNTQTYHYNSFVNNNYTFDFNYQLPSNYTNQQIYFYNNLVNDTGYVNPDSFYTDELIVPPNTVLHLNTTLQAGQRAYSSSRMIGGNYWAHPNGTGYSQTATDADTDGFTDIPFDVFGNATIYDYLPYTSNFIENVVNLIITPQVSTIKAGTSVTFVTTAHDKYGNSWNVTADYTIDGTSFNGTLTGHYTDSYYIEASYGGKTANTTIAVAPGDVDHYVVLTATSVKVDTPFAIKVVAVDAYSNIVTDFSGSVSLSVNNSSISPTKTGDFTNGIWTGTATIPSIGTFKVTATDSNGNTGTSVALTVTDQETTTPTPTPSPSSSIQATKEDNSKVNLGLDGNISSSQISDVTITTNQTAQTVTVSLTITGQSGYSGFCNLTIPKSTVNFAIAPTILIDGQPAANQGYTEDDQNFYVWFTTTFSTHQIDIEFNEQPTTSPGAGDVYWWATPAAAIIALVLVSIVIAIRFSRKTKTGFKQSKV
jgi:nitrous oxidase accessory protein